MSKRGPVKSITHHVLVIATLFLCLGGFLYNTYETFYKFITGARLVLTLSTSQSQLPLPVFVLCNHTAYKELPIGNNTIWQQEKYLELTRDPLNMLFDVKDGNGVVSYTAKELHTTLQGRCLAIEIHQKVK